MSLDRRSFLKTGAAAASLAALGSLSSLAAQAAGEKKFKISFAAWSINRSFRKDWVCLDLPRIVREWLDLDGLEFVNSHFELPTYNYLKDLKKRLGDYGVTPVLIMCDDDGDCFGTWSEFCSDGIDCTFDECDGPLAEDCRHKVKPGWCLVDGECFEDGVIDPLRPPGTSPA